MVAAARDTEKFAQLDPAVMRIAVGGEAAGWQSYEALLLADPAFVPDGETRAEDPLLLYFTSGTTARPKLVLHSHSSYPVGHLSTMYWLGLQPGDLHLNVSSPGWAKHAWSCFFAPWNAGAGVFIANQPRFDAVGLLDAIAAHGGDHLVRAADGVAHADPAGSQIVEDAAARGLQRRRAAQPGGDRAGPGGLGHDHPRRLRPDRDDGADRQSAGSAGEAGLDGAGRCRAIASHCSIPRIGRPRRGQCASRSPHVRRR